LVDIFESEYLIWLRSWGFCKEY